MPAYPPPTLTVTLGFDGELRLLYPNGKSIDLPKGDAEARMREILQGFAKPLAAYRAEVANREYSDLPPNAAIRHIGQGVKLPPTKLAAVMDDILADL